MGPATAGATSRYIFLAVIYLLRCKGRSFVARMAGLTPNRASSFASVFLLGLDHVAGRGLGGVGGIFLGGGQAGLDLTHFFFQQFYALAGLLQLLAQAQVLLAKGMVLPGQAHHLLRQLLAKVPLQGVKP